MVIVLVVVCEIVKFVFVGDIDEVFFIECKIEIGVGVKSFIVIFVEVVIGSIYVIVIVGFFLDDIDYVGDCV